MINKRHIRQLARTQILNADLLPVADIAWENRAFDPSGKTLWLRETLLPVSDESADDVDESADVIMQYDVFVPAASGSEAVEDMCKNIAALFTPGADIKDENICLVPYEITSLTGVTDTPWYFQSLHIKMRVYPASF